LIYLYFDQSLFAKNLKIQMLSESEAERYDRQIRVWGAEAQERIQKSNVLICGLNDLNVEV
jgi:molybdopterin/thiamine biosynthesis adenylyltransferase